jgi:Cys-rich protein (TIGR01571 family)
VKAANNARMHKKNCKSFAQHLKLISNLLEQLNLTDLKQRPECREPLEHLEHALRKAVVLVESCRDKSYLYLVAMGWVYVTKFRDYQDEIDRYLRLIPLISLVDNTRERLRAITKDKRLYTMDESEVKVQKTLLKPERTKRDSLRLSKQLSRRYPGLPLDLALREENAKLRQELEQMKACMEGEECDVIEHLIDFTEAAASDPVILKEAMTQIREEDEDEDERRRTSDAVKESSKRHVRYPKPSLQGYPPPHQKIMYDGAVRKDPSYPSSPSHSIRSNNVYQIEDWHHDLFQCCSDPCLCLETFCYPCETFTLVAEEVTEGQTSQDSACQQLAFHSLYGGCYCYTCCIRRKVRQRFNIPGECFSDYCTHACCCCCAVLQELHELRFQEKQARTMQDPPSEQEMEGY